MALIMADSVHQESLHFVTAALPNLGIGSTVINKEKFDELYKVVDDKMKEEFNLESDLDLRYAPAGSKNLCVKAGGGKDCNAFTLRVNWNIVAFDIRNVEIILTLARVMAKVPENRDIEIKLEWKAAGLGY